MSDFLDIKRPSLGLDKQFREWVCAVDDSILNQSSLVKKKHSPLIDDAARDTRISLNGYS